MRFLSLCSGIEAASVAWAPLGWKAAAVAEIEAFPSAVLAHHYPDVPNLGDITKFKEWPDLGTIDLICGGTPCQSFSIAGLRKGLADPRGNLSLTFLAIVDRYRPRYVIWENVPGVLSSDGGRDFAAFLGGLGQLGYGWAFRVLDAQHVRVDGFPRAVPQRRRRVFVVGYLGDWRRAAAVLSESESVLGNSPPRRHSREGVAAGALAGTSPGGGWRIGPDEAAANHIVAEVAATLPSGGNSTGGDRQPGTSAETAATMLVVYPVAETLTSNGDAHSGFREAAGLVAHSLRAAGAHPPSVATGWAVRRLMPVECERLQGFPDNYTLIRMPRAVRKQVEADFATYLRRQYLEQGWGEPTVADLTRLAADGPRYKALGNSWAVNVARWVGRRIEMVEQIAAEDLAEAAE